MKQKKSTIYTMLLVAALLCNIAICLAGKEQGNISWDEPDFAFDEDGTKFYPIEEGDGMKYYPADDVEKN